MGSRKQVTLRAALKEKEVGQSQSPRGMGAEALGVGDRDFLARTLLSPLLGSANIYHSWSHVGYHAEGEGSTDKQGRVLLQGILRGGQGADGGSPRS